MTATVLLRGRVFIAALVILSSVAPGIGTAVARPRHRIYRHHHTASWPRAGFPISLADPDIRIDRVGQVVSQPPSPPKAVRNDPAAIAGTYSPSDGTAPNRAKRPAHYRHH